MAEAENGEQRDDRQQTLRMILQSRASNLAEELRAIEQHVHPVRKDHRWAASPRCLLHKRSLGTCFRLIRNPRLKQPFVAVSWTCNPSVHEDPRSGKYWITHVNPRRQVQSKIRNSLFDRVVKYLKHVKIHIFWIDQECIDQRPLPRRDQALNSMDLVYRNATRSIGLLTTPIRTQNGLDLMEHLLSGDMCCKKGASGYEFRRGVKYDIIEKVIRILQNLTEDPWWTRAWIFQEEYVAGLHMYLLIPLGPGAQLNQDPADIPGEMCVRASDFREQATMFLLAYSDTPWKKYSESCRNMLRVVGKYTLLLSEEVSGLQPMSARIFADIGRRDVTEPWDTLATTANACGYEIRLDKSNLIQEGRSLSLSLLALFILNGEIFISALDSDGDGNDPLNVTVANFLKKLSPKNCDIPVESRQLSFLKHCRFPEVRFCPFGVSTFGFTWELRSEHRIHTREFALPAMPYESEAYYECHPWETLELNALACALGQYHPSLAQKLRNYIKRRRAGCISAATSYMDIMAWNLVRAIARRHILRVGYLVGGGGGAIFVPGPGDIYESMYAFTAWQEGYPDDHESDKFVSLKVKLTRNNVLKAIDWMNGLVFFFGKKPERVVFDLPGY